MTDDKELCLLQYIHKTEEKLRVLLLENVEYIPSLRSLMGNAELFVVAADEALPHDEQYRTMDIHWITVNYLAEKLPLPEESFDIIMGEELFLEAWNPQDIASGLGSYLKGTGFLLTTFTNARYWRNIRDMMNGHFYHVCTHVFTRNEMMSLLGASFFKDTYFLPVEGARQDGAFIQQLEAMGFDNSFNDLSVKTWMVQATKSIAEVMALKQLYTREIRRELVNRLRRTEYGINVAENVKQLWRLFEEAMMFPEYVADFVRQTIIRQEEFLAHFINELNRLGHEDWGRTFLKALAWPYSPEPTMAQPGEALQKGSLPPGEVSPDRKIAFITCVNKEEWYEECQLFINHLAVPEGMQVELIPVRGAASMCAGYNWGMKQTDARYKVYIHQDAFIGHRDFIKELLAVFQDKTIGALGVIGARSLPKTGIWWDGMRTVGRVLHACEAESVVDSLCLDIDGPYVEVEAVDGLLVATQVDIPWREDLFTGWHFYEIAQCMELKRRGYRVVVPRQEPYSWCIHCPKEKALDPAYKVYQKIFLQEYGSELHPEID